MLGPVEVLRDETSLELGPRQRRVLLTRLLIEDGRPVPLSELCRDLWQWRQPPGAVSSIRAHISRLRSVLDPVGQARSSVLVNGPGGYALRVPREERATVLFDESLARARDAFKRRQMAMAREEIDSALALWRGTPLGEAADHAFAIREMNRLNTAHQDAMALQVAILIKMGDAEQAIDVASALTTSAPLREEAWALLMRALYSAGRSAEALQQYESFRAMLAEDLGLDPTPGLRDLQTAILQHDKGVLGEQRVSRTTALISPGPNAAVQPLVGRVEETARLASVLEAAAAGHTQWALLFGEPGSGKSRLLDETCAQAEAAEFTVTRLSGGQTPTERQSALLYAPSQLPHGLPQAGGATPSQNGATEIPLAALLRELSQGPALCVIDDLDRATPEFHTTLRQLASVLRDAPVAVLCALRDANDPTVGRLLADLARHGATWLHLEPLSVAEVGELLSARGESVSAEKAAALHRRSEGNPFLLRELLKLPPGQRTGAGARVPTSVHSIIQASLADLPPGVRTLLSYAAAHSETLDLDLLADVQGITRGRLMPLIDIAVTARMLVWDADPDESTVGRYRLPELHREIVLSTLTPSSRQMLHAAYARELAGRDGVEPTQLARHLRAAGPMFEDAERYMGRVATPDSGR
ncbi:BTAD domain-containing putative transcriptional regulator [Streptomyces chartreusis]|uniref:BTAD domain-containing putative transcriptional regulator n=1 Tax=Streptomyces chartreusis TaxID=1969 RepID=UPI0038680904|nr:AAA family ATPase [Streptomyces chartreusis]WTA33414.1 AAA family ATPase [Streptomyces chartreusis]